MKVDEDEPDVIEQQIDDNIYNDRGQRLFKEVVWAANRARNALDTSCAVCGEPGGGKSTVGATKGYWYQKIMRERITGYNYVFGIRNTAFNAAQFVKLIETAPKYTAILYDESDESTNNKATMTRTARLFVQHMETCRYKGLFIIMCKPDFSEFSRYVAITRTVYLVVCTYKVFPPQGEYKEPIFKKGFYSVYDRRSKALLYLNLKKFKGYNRVKPSYNGFVDIKDLWFFNEDGGADVYQAAKETGLSQIGQKKVKPYVSSNTHINALIKRIKELDAARESGTGRALTYLQIAQQTGVTPRLAYLIANEGKWSEDELKKVVT